MPNTEADLFPPHDLTAERAILAAMRLSGDAAAWGVEELKPEHFYAPQHRVVFTCLLRLYSQGKPLDLAVMKDDLEAHGELETIGGFQWLQSLDEEARGANIGLYVDIVKRHYIRRRVLGICSQGVRESYDDTISADDLLMRVERDILNLGMDDSHQGKPIGQIIKQATEKAGKLFEHPSKTSFGIGSGYKDLDEVIGGFRPGQFVIVAARPSIGKTTFALNLLRNMATRQHASCLFFSLETSDELIADALLAAEAKVNLSKLQSGEISETELNEIIKEVGPRLYEPAVTIDDDASLTVLDICNRTRRYYHQKKADVVFVDYLQFIQPSDRRLPREQQVSEISRCLKQLAKDLGVTVIALSQLNRKLEETGDKEPLLSHLRESGAIEQDADIVMLLNRPDYYDPADRPNQLIVKVAKNRHGQTGAATLMFFRDQSRIENLYEKETEYGK